MSINEKLRSTLRDADSISRKQEENKGMMELLHGNKNKLAEKIERAYNGNPAANLPENKDETKKLSPLEEHVNKTAIMKSHPIENEILLPRKISESEIEKIKTDADSFFLKGEYRNAAAMYEQAMLEEQGNITPQCISKLAQSYLFQGFYDKAAGTIEAALNSGKINDRWISRDLSLMKARALTLKCTPASLDDAAAECDKLCSENYMDIDAKVEKALAESMRSYEQTLAETAQIIQFDYKKEHLYTGSLKSAEFLAKYFVSQADYSTAKSLCNAIMKIKPSPEIEELNLSATESSSTFPEFEAEIKKAVELFPTSQFISGMQKKYMVITDGKDCR